MEAPVADSVPTLAFARDLQKQRVHRNLFQFTIRLRSEFEALRRSILHHYPLFSLREAVIEFIFDHTYANVVIIIGSSSVYFITHYSCNSISSSCFAWLSHSWIILSRANQGQRSRGSLKVVCWFYKKPRHVISACKARERLYGQYVLFNFKSSVVASTLAPAPASQSSTGSLSSVQLS